VAPDLSAAVEVVAGLGGPLVSVSPDGREHDQARYLTDPFRGVNFDDFSINSVRFSWHEMWSPDGEPM
jgi:hypothetical protein